MLKTRSASTSVSPIALLLGGNQSPKWVHEGVQVIGHFGSSDSYLSYNKYPELGELEKVGNISLSSFSPYGVCDNYQQILDQCPEIVDSTEREFMITLTEIRKEDQPAQGGWRWHKWGEYIGKHAPQHEYLYNEKDIEAVFCYHVYEFKK